MVAVQKRIELILECALRVDSLMEGHSPFGRAFEGWKPMVRHRTHSIEFKRQVVQEYLAGETLTASPSGICRETWSASGSTSTRPERSTARRKADFGDRVSKGALKPGPSPRSATLGPHNEGGTVAELVMGNLQLDAPTADDRLVFRPVDLEGFAGLERQRHEGAAPARVHLALTIHFPGTCRGGDTAVRPLTTGPALKELKSAEENTREVFQR
jgi:hypothetical protein